MAVPGEHLIPPRKGGRSSDDATAFVILGQQPFPRSLLSLVVATGK